MAKQKHELDRELLDSEEAEIVALVEPIKCKECLSDNVYAEPAAHSEWSGDVEISFSYTTYTCLDCGEVWVVKG